MNTTHVFMVILVSAIVTFFTRAFPFFLFGKGEKMHPALSFIGRTLPLSVIAVLVVYCLKDALCTSFSALWPQLAGVAATVLLHLWKRNNLISIGGGTLLYMILIRI